MPKLKDFTCNDCIYSHGDDCYEGKLVEPNNKLGCAYGEFLIKMLKFKAVKNKPPYYHVSRAYLAWAIASGEKFQKVKIPE